MSATMSEATRLRAQGMTYAVIGEHLDCSTTQAWRYCNPERERVLGVGRNTYKRQYENAMRASCASCGEPMGAGSRKADGSRRKTKGQLCAACISNNRVDLVLEMWRLRETEHLTNRAIAERLDTPVRTIAAELNRLRATGFPVPLAPYRGADKRPSRACVADPSAVKLAAALLGRGITP